LLPQVARGHTGLFTATPMPAKAWSYTDENPGVNAQFEFL